MAKKVKSLIPPSKYSPEEKALLVARGRELYMEGSSIATVAKELGVSQAIMAKWSAEGEVSWAVEREERVRGLLEDGFNRRKIAVSEVANMNIGLIKQGLNKIEERVTPLTINEIERLSAVHGVLDKIARLDAGKSTENTSVQARVKLSLEDIKSIISEDPVLGEE